jgi:hypothetical protein
VRLVVILTLAVPNNPTTNLNTTKIHELLFTISFITTATRMYNSAVILTTPLHQSTLAQALNVPQLPAAVLFLVRTVELMEW